MVDRCQREETPLPEWFSSGEISSSGAVFSVKAMTLSDPYECMARQWMRHLATTPQTEQSAFIENALTAFTTRFPSATFSEERLLNAYIETAFRTLHDRYAFEDGIEETLNLDKRPARVSTLHVPIFDQKTRKKSYQIDEEEKREHIQRSVQCVQKALERDFAQSSLDRALLTERCSLDQLTRVAEATLQDCWAEYKDTTGPQLQQHTEPRSLPRSRTMDELEQEQELVDICNQAERPPAPLTIDDLVALAVAPPASTSTLLEDTPVQDSSPLSFTKRARPSSPVPEAIDGC